MHWLIGGSSFGKIYPTLHALLKDELVTVRVIRHQDRPSRKIYDISEKGRQLLSRWLDEPVSPNASLKTFIMRLILIQDLSQKGVVDQLRQRRAEIVAHRDALKEMSGGSQQAGVGWQMALDYGLTLTDTELDWLDRALDQTVEPFAEEVVGT
jgi:DNA-binding PadR family transcriptional regulator